MSDEGRPVAPHRSGGGHWVGPTREETSMAELIANVTAPAPLPEEPYFKPSLLEEPPESGRVIVYKGRERSVWDQDKVMREYADDLRARLQEAESTCRKHAALYEDERTKRKESESRAAALQKELTVCKRVMTNEQLRQVRAALSKESPDE